MKRYPHRSACVYYRIDVPQRFLSGWESVTKEIPGATTAEDMVQYVTDMLNHDVVHAYATGGEFGVALLKCFTETPCETMPDGRIVTPPAMILDLDDNIDYVHPLNPRFNVLGTKIPGHGWLKPGEAVNITLPSGEVVPVWEDKKTRSTRGEVFDIERNIRGIKQLCLVLKRSQGASFTTERLRSYYEKAHNLRNTYVFPNSVIVEDYPVVRLERDPGTIKVLWQGGDSHYADWFEIREGLREATKRFPEIKWLIWGTRYPWIHDVLPRERVEYIQWVPYDAYKVRLATIDYDIALAPLVGSIFNESKSAIKWYESSVLTPPKPVLASNVPPYSDEMQDGVNGMLYSSTEEFLQKLEILVRSKEKRDELAGNARKWILKHRQARNTVPKYGDWLLDTATRHQERRRKMHLRNVRPRPIRIP